MRLVLVLVAWSLMAQPEYDCGADLAVRWNRFASDANSYIHLQAVGGTDYALRRKVEKEFDSVKKCQCW